MKSNLHLTVFAAFIFLLVFTVDILSQKLYDIIPDTRSNTVSADIVIPLYLQIEIGGRIETKKYYFNFPSFAQGIDSYLEHDITLPSILFRYGIFKNMELSAGVEFLTTAFSNNGHKIKGVSPFIIGTKIKIMDELEEAPETAFLFNIFLPHGKDRNFQPDYIGSSFRFAMHHTISRKFSLSYNLGGEWDGNEPQPGGLYTLLLSYSPSKKLSFFAESYGFFKQKAVPDLRTEAGISLLARSNIMFDISGELGLTGKSPDYIISGGMSIRLPR